MCYEDYLTIQTYISLILFILYFKFSVIDIRLAETVYNRACMSYKQTSPQPRRIVANSWCWTGGPILIMSCFMAMWSSVTVDRAHSLHCNNQKWTTRKATPCWPAPYWIPKVSPAAPAPICNHSSVIEFAD